MVVLLTDESDAEVLPALTLLNFDLSVFKPSSTEILRAAEKSALLILDARSNLSSVRTLSQNLKKLFPDVPLLLVVTEGGFTAVHSDWRADDMLLNSASPAEISARFRLAAERLAESGPAPGPINAAGIIIDESSYSAKLHGQPLDLTYKEFELLRFLAHNPARVFSREQLLSEVWGYDYFGGTRTVDVHIRRLRAKLGDLGEVIGTVRNVGYRFLTEQHKTEE